MLAKQCATNNDVATCKVAVAKCAESQNNKCENGLLECTSYDSIRKNCEKDAAACNQEEPACQKKAEQCLYKDWRYKEC